MTSPTMTYGDQAIVNRSLLSAIRHHNAAFRDLMAGKVSAAQDEADQAAAILELVKGFEEGHAGSPGSLQTNEPAKGEDHDPGIA